MTATAWTLTRRVMALIAGATLLLFIAAPSADAHPLNTSAVLLDLDANRVTATIDLPLDQLSVAFNQDLTTTNVLDVNTLTTLRNYVQAHLTASDTTGQTWSTRVTGGQVDKVDGADNLVLAASLTPSSGVVGNFVLQYDAVMDKLISHRVFVSARVGDTGDYTVVTMLSWQRTTVPIALTGPSKISGFMAAVHLGSQHIRSGSDHLLFLTMLLLPAPLAVRGRRWVRGPTAGVAMRRVVHVVSAFAVGHSATLALGALGWVELPPRLVESGIALSVLVAALHAIRPIVRRGEVIIAFSFGLLHGLSFAAVLGGLDLSRRSLLSTLLGFNLGIELAQLLVVALLMPSLIVLSRTSLYRTFRTCGATLGAGLATGWLAERTGIVSSNPFEPVSQLLVNYPLELAAGFALFAVTAAVAQHVQRYSQHTVPGPHRSTQRDQYDAPIVARRSIDRLGNLSTATSHHLVRLE